VYKIMRQSINISHFYRPGRAFGHKVWFQLAGSIPGVSGRGRKGVN